MAYLKTAEARIYHRGKTAFFVLAGCPLAGAWDLLKRAADLKSFGVMAGDACWREHGKWE